jgi:nucleoside-diphosphate-sugar epimerase
MEAYRASKTLAERSAWDFVDQSENIRTRSFQSKNLLNLYNKDKPSFDIATVNPPFVFGPIIHQVPSRDKLNTSVAIFDAFIRGEKSENDLSAYVGNWIDVRDVAEAHVQVLIQEHAGGQRWGPSVGPVFWQGKPD